MGRQHPKGSSDACTLITAREHHPLQGMAAQAYANRDFKETVQLLTDLIAREPDSPRWYEMRAQARLICRVLMLSTPALREPDPRAARMLRQDISPSSQKLGRSH